MTSLDTQAWMPGSQNNWPLGVTLAHQFLNHVINVGLGPPSLASLCLLAHPDNRNSLVEHIKRSITFSGWIPCLDNYRNLNVIISFIQAMSLEAQAILFHDMALLCNIISNKHIPCVVDRRRRLVKQISACDTDVVMKYAISIYNPDAVRSLRAHDNCYCPIELISYLHDNTIIRGKIYKPYDGFIPYRVGTLAEMIDAIGVTARDILNLPSNYIGYKIAAHFIRTDASVDLDLYLKNKYKIMFISDKLHESVFDLIEAMEHYDWSRVSDKTLFFVYTISHDYLPAFTDLLERHIFDLTRRSPCQRFQANFDRSNPKQCFALYNKMRQTCSLCEGFWELTLYIFDQMIGDCTGSWKLFVDSLSLREQSICFNTSSFNMIKSDQSMVNVIPYLNLMSAEKRFQLIITIVNKHIYPWSAKTISKFLTALATDIRQNAKRIVKVLVNKIRTSYSISFNIYDGRKVSDEILMYLVKHSERFGITDAIEDLIIDGVFDYGKMNYSCYYTVKRIALEIWGWEKDEFDLYILKLALRRRCYTTLVSYFSIDNHSKSLELRNYVRDHGFDSAVTTRLLQCIGGNK